LIFQDAGILMASLKVSSDPNRAPGAVATITEALQSASPGDQIEIASGEYRETLVIDKPIVIAGAGIGKSRILGSLRILSADVALSDLSIGQAPQTAIVVAATRILIRRVSVEGAGECGIRWDEASDGIAAGLELSGCAEAGIDIGEAAEPIIRTFEIHDMAKFGIRIAAKTRPRIEQGEIRGCASAGIEMSGRDANAHVRGVRIHDLDGPAVSVHGGAGGTILECEIYDCRNGSAILVAGHGTAPVLSNCRIHDVAQRGISIADQAAPQITGGEICGCGLDAVQVSGKGCNPKITGVHIHDTGGSGIVLEAETSGTIADCDISKCGSGNGAIAVRRSAPVITGCQLHDTRRCGIWIFHAAPRIDGGEIYGCEVGIFVDGGKTVAGTRRPHPEIAGVWIHDVAIGLVLDQYSSGTVARMRIEKCREAIRKDAGSSVIIEDTGIELAIAAPPPPVPAKISIEARNARLSEFPALGAAMAELNGLIGLARVKEEIGNLVNVAIVERHRRKSGLPAVEPISLHMVFIGGPGSGKTTVARLIGRIYAALGFLSKGHYVKAERADLVAEYLGQTAPLVRAKVAEALDGVLLIDEAYLLAPQNASAQDYGKEAIGTLLTEMEDKRGRLAVICAGYPDEMIRFINSNPGLRSRFERYVGFDDYSPEELTQIFMKLCAENHFRVTAGVEQRALEFLTEICRRQGPGFGNARGVRVMFGEVRVNHAARFAADANVDASLLTEQDIPTLARDQPIRDLASIRAELDGLVGLARVKQEVRKLVSVAELERRRRERHLPSVESVPLHMVFTGNPGSGKTTVARLMGEFYAALKFLDSGHLVEVDRSNLVGSYMGQTAVKMKEYVRLAIGGVLFIDEAYALVPEGAWSYDYGREAINTLVKAMEDNRDRLAIIVAGYSKEMKRFIESNPGLRERFTRYVHFEDFDADELTQIFIKMCGDNHFQLAHGVEDSARDLFTDLYTRRSADFANGRTVRNVFANVREQISERAIANLDEDPFIITPDDIIRVRAELEKLRPDDGIPKFGFVDFKKS
jgi:SpoVK/Ycf46/Vps4 family AAA+-type ATPase/nitrous oxidase accessory protein NosD